MIKLVLFDLDGTLVNTIADLADTVNFALTKMGFPIHETEKYNYFVGNGFSNLVETALPEDKRTKEIHKECLGIAKAYYEEHYLDKSRPYDGIPELLTRLKEKGYKIAVISNKYHKMAVTVVNTLFGETMFDAVYGQMESYPVKPEPTLTLKIISDLKETPDNTVMIGDSGMDMAVAVNAKCKGIGVLWGFRTEGELRENGADYIVSQPEDILEILEAI